MYHLTSIILALSTFQFPHYSNSSRTLTQDLKGKQSAVEKPFHELARRLDARERELTQMASEGAKMAEAAADLEAFVAAKKEELEKASPISAKIDKLRDQVMVWRRDFRIFFILKSSSMTFKLLIPRHTPEKLDSSQLQGSSQ